MSKYLEFVEKERKPKTKVYAVKSKFDGCELGEIKWHSAWQNYCFFPTIQFPTVHSNRCLNDISEFISKVNKEPRILKSRESCAHNRICKVVKIDCKLCKSWQAMEVKECTNKKEAKVK